MNQPGNARNKQALFNGLQPIVMSRYRDILNAADRFFEQVASDQPAALACRAGCTLCCHGLFEISAADVPVMSEGLDRLDPSIRAAIVASAEQIVAATAHPALRDCTPEQKEDFFRRADDVPCPALGADGRCQIYESRPLLCRTFGLPIREGETFLGEECELNFQESTDEDRKRAAWDLLDEDAHGSEDELTIPEAILMIERLRLRKS